MSKPPSATADKFLLRLPDGMRERLSAAAVANRRSVTAEVIARLEASFSDAATAQIGAATGVSAADIGFLLSKYRHDVADLDLQLTIARMRLYETALGLLIASNAGRGDLPPLSEDDYQAFQVDAKEAMDAGWKGYEGSDERIKELEASVSDLVRRADALGLTS